MARKAKAELNSRRLMPRNNSWVNVYVSFSLAPENNFKQNFPELCNLLILWELRSTDMCDGYSITGWVKKEREKFRDLKVITFKIWLIGINAPSGSYLLWWTGKYPQRYWASQRFPLKLMRELDWDRISTWLPECLRLSLQMWKLNLVSRFPCQIHLRRVTKNLH